MSLSKNTSRPLAAAQRGVGLIEVLVSILILGIGVLGYSVLQVRAVGATSEGVYRSQALMVLRGVADEMRANAFGQASYPAAIRSYTGFSASTAAAKNCTGLAYPAVCTSTEMATFDAYNAAQAAFNLGTHLAMTVCPGDLTRQCLFAAWGQTTLSNISATGVGAPSATDCATTAGVYQQSATCVMMEAY